MSTTVKSKAQLKREKDNRESVTNSLRFKLKSFKNVYLQSSIDHEIRSREFSIKKLNKEILSVEDGTIKPKYSKNEHITSLKNRISRFQNDLDHSAILTLETLKSADASFEIKINKLIEKLLEEGFGVKAFKVERIGAGWDSFTFLISNDLKEVHARVIFANGEVNAPHFRFIITTRQK